MTGNTVCPNPACMNVNPIALIAAIANASDDQERAHLLRQSGKSLLLAPAAIAEIAVAAIDPEDGSSTQAALLLLAGALDEARMAAENGTPEGSALLDTLAAILGEQDAACPFAPVTRLRLAQAYARAGLAPPAFAMLTPENMTGDLPDGQALPDLGELLDPLLREIGDEPLQVHAALAELLAGLPLEPAAMLVSMTLERPGAVEARVGLYWLLSPQLEIRLAAATALLSRAETGSLSPDLAVLLPAIRKWMPDDPARVALDAVIRRQMRKGGLNRNTPAATIHRAAASLPDGAGAQSLIAAFQNGSHRGIAMAMLKQGHGVKDAFILPCASATEQKRMLARILEEIEAFDVSPGALTEALACGLGEGQLLGLLPAAGLVDWAELIGSEGLSPVTGEASDILEAIGGLGALGELSASQRAALIKTSADWTERFAQGDAWFEDTTDLRAAISRARTEKGQEAAVWKHLETRRDWWARLFAVSAATLKAAEEQQYWLSFAAVAQELLGGAALKRIPVMAEIVDMTLDAFDAREGHAPHVPEAGTIGPLLAHAGLNETYVQGYLAALAISPREPSPEVWLGALLGGVEFPGHGAIDQLLAFVTIEAERANDEAGDPKLVSGWIAAFGAANLQDWAAGFENFVAACPRAWPTKSLAADDKRVLREIGAVAKGNDGSALRAVLPSWIARRYEMRQ
ncbi:UPF0149 family protein [Paracoccus sp. PAR01]|uniref:UPF0149 family protein n=1 Tax=Paracoccus sp. PAR01 TaxID=2769282 RepID=UPI0017807C8E|nr:UPF0149 family protein [Paracoccus sp. PAR01]MBD9529906.1 UPF0149 family protein [Paracoccus sp. PAR01]